MTSHARTHSRRINLLILGGTCRGRLGVARSFHGTSLALSGPLVHVDCRRDEPRVRAALEMWIAGGAGDPTPTDFIGVAERGTLFLDRVGSLAEASQHLLLAFVRRCVELPIEWGGAAWAGRLAVGDGRELIAAVRSGRFLLPLFDDLDKVRVDLESSRVA